MQDKNIVTVDLETTVKNETIGKNNKPSPFHPPNRIVAAGKSTLDPNTGKSEYQDVYYSSSRPVKINSDKNTLVKSTSRMIGHNLKFDIHYMRKSGMKDFHTINVWDTQLAEYILSGQQDKFPKLDDVAPRYLGGTPKLDKVKELWDAGVQTEDIDEDLLLDYLEGDVKNTELVAMAQMQRCMDEGILPFVETQMDAVLAVEEMEYNGMHIDTKQLAKLSVHLQSEKLNLSIEAVRRICVLHPELEDHQDLIKLDSPKVLQKILFGGTIEYKVKEKVGLYKNGKDKFKQVVHSVTLTPLYTPLEEWQTKTGISTSDSVLEVLSKYGTYGIPNLLQELRGVSKELSTYIEGISSLIYPDGKIHGSLHQTSTTTGRLSSAQPNLQNMPSSDESQIKTIFSSRFGREGMIIEADYKQLEVIGLAFLSNDKQLINDILTGKDMHKETGKLVFGVGMTKDERRTVKTINFGLIYGGKAGTLAKQANVTKDLAQKCIDAFYTRYPQVKQWQEDTFKEVVINREFKGHTSHKGYPSGRSTYKSVTGRKYVFKEYDKPDWMTWEKNNCVFSPQETRNYPVQGFATADVVPMMVGILHKVLKNDPRTKDTCLMINTVHDSIIFDCDVSDLHYSMRLIKETLEDAPKYIREKLGINFNLPLKVDITYGKNWKEQTGSLAEYKS